VRLLVVSDLYPPAVRGGYEVECHDVVGHLRSRHEVSVLTTTYGADQAPHEPCIRRALPWSGLSRIDGMLAPLAAARARRVMRETLAHAAPEAVFLWSGSGIPSAGLRELQESGLPLLVRVCEYWFGSIFTGDQFTKWLVGDRRGPARDAWGVVMRTANRAPALRVSLEDRIPAAVSFNSEYVRAHARPPGGFQIVHEDITFPTTARAPQLDGCLRDPLPGRVLFVGRLEPEKGAQVLVRALARLRDRHGIDATLHIVGGGTTLEASALTELAQRHNVGAQVDLLGRREGDDLALEIAAASVWAVPSVWQEPASLTALEAAISRVPVVASRVGGIPEVLAPDTCALFHEPDDADGCAQALALTLAGGTDVVARVERAHSRARALSFEPYLERIDRFLEDGLAALRAAGDAGGDVAGLSRRARARSPARGPGA
jgi:glycosyltransferase involved in cell wall biosynthesis